MNNNPKPLLFVAMPFGKKKDHTGIYEIDFDQIYEQAIKPIALDPEVNLEVIRADEERMGGIIHVPMYERLLLSEIVIADLTNQNPNVFYELGIRHCARPRSTILIFAESHQLPFDTAMIRAIPYKLENGILTDNEINNLKVILKEKLLIAKEDQEFTDSPLFQLISNFPGINLPHEVTESFRDRVKYIDNQRNLLIQAKRMPDKNKAITTIKNIENSIGGINEINSEIIIDIILSYRDVKAWDEMISLIEKLPKGLFSDTITIREQYAFALNRRNQQGDKDTAIDILLNLIEKYGYSPETCGIIGRIYKDLYEESKNQALTEEAKGYLNQAIEYYSKGFETDPRDYYPGINAATLLFVKGDTHKLKEILPAVAFAVIRRGGMNSKDYWDVATTLEVNVLSEDWKNAQQTIIKLISIRPTPPSWNFETTLKNLNIIRNAKIEKKESIKELDKIISYIEQKI